MSFMRKLFGILLAAVLLLGMGPAFAEVNWNAWTLESAGFWWRSGTDPAKPNANYHQYARGATELDLQITSFLEVRWEGANSLNTMTYYRWGSDSVEAVIETSRVDGIATEGLERHYHEDGTLYQASRTTYDAGHPILTEIEYYDDLGNTVQSSLRTYDSEGRVLREEDFNIGGNSLFIVSYEHLGNDEYIRTITKHDGTLLQREANVFLDLDADGKKMFRYYILESYDPNGNLTNTTDPYPDGGFLNRWLYNVENGGFVTQTQQIAYIMGSDITQSFLVTEYDVHGNFVKGTVYDPLTGETHAATQAPAGDLLRDLWIKKNPGPGKPAHVWYPSNTLTTAGLAFRDEKPGLTDKWYQFVPLDLSRDGEQQFELVGGSVYLLGKVTVTVAGDSVTVDYRISHGKHGNVMMESEFFTLFPDLAGVTSVEMEDLGEGYSFGQPLSIEKDLKGDTRVLLFVRNVATFSDHVSPEIARTRYWHKLPSRVQMREALRSLMD